MAKYIDADKLKAEIEKRAKFHDDAMKACIGLHNIAITHSAGWKEDTELLTIINSLQQEHPMPDSTKLIELWHEDKEMLKEKDFRNDPWRLAFNAFLCGFGRGISVKQEQPEEVNEDFFFDEVLRVYDDNDKYPPRSEEELTMLEIIASHFFELGQYNAKKKK